ALADLARDVDVGEELHLDLEDPLALAVLAAPAFHVEAEAARLVAAQARLGYPGEELADRPEEPRIGSRIGARGAADRALVDLDHLVDLGGALEGVVRAGIVPRPVQHPRQGAIQDVRHEGALPRARDAGDRDEPSERE